MYKIKRRESTNSLARVWYELYCIVCFYHDRKLQSKFEIKSCRCGTKGY